MAEYEVRVSCSMHKGGKFVVRADTVEAAHEAAETLLEEGDDCVDWTVESFVDGTSIDSVTLQESSS